MSKYMKRKSCAGCNCAVSEMQTILNLGDVPLAGFFPSHEERLIQRQFPLSLLYCDKCKLVQTDSTVDPDFLFKDYRYISSVGLASHFESFAGVLDNRFNVSSKKILEFGCNDGPLLKPLKLKGAETIGVDPATNIVKLARDKGLQVINDFFNFSNFGNEKHAEAYDLVLANNTFAHVPDLQDIIKTVKHVLKAQGHFVFEVHYLKNLIEEKQWDNIYHEHIYYYSVTALDNLFKSIGMTLVDFEEIPIHAGSIRVYVQNSLCKQSKKIKDRINEELTTLSSAAFFKAFKTEVSDHIDKVKEDLHSLSKNKKIIGYGASGRANMFCNIVDVSGDVVKYIVDESPERFNRYIANKKIPIVSKDVLEEDDEIDVIFILAWNYSKMIMEKTKHKKCKYYIAFPVPQLVSSVEELRGFESI